VTAELETERRCTIRGTNIHQWKMHASQHGTDRTIKIHTRITLE